MGFFSKLKKKVKKLVLDLPLTGISGLITKSALITPRLIKTDPVGSATKAIVLGGIAAAALSPATAGRAAVSLIPKSVVGKVGAAFTGITVGTVLVKSPKARKAVSQAPKTFIQTGLTGGEIIADVIETGKPKVGAKEALITGGLLAGGIVAAVGAVAVVKSIKKLPSILPLDKTIVPAIVPEKAIGLEGEIPILPETATITTGKKPYKRRRAKKTPSIRQSVRINIINKPRNTGLRITNKRYLNAELLC